MDSTEEMDSSLTDCNQDQDENSGLIVINKCFYLGNPDAIIRYHTLRSSLEMLLVLHLSLSSMSEGCQCHVGDLFTPFNTDFLKKCFTSMKYIFESV